MDANSDASFRDTLKNRLDEVFQEESSDIQGGNKEDESVKASHPLDGLKSAVLSLEWEITQENVHRFIKETKDCLKRYEGDKVFSTFFQVLLALGKYVHKSMKNAHPATGALIKSTFENVTAVIDTGLGEEEKRKLLNKSLAAFRQFKASVLAKKRKAAPEASETAVPEKTIKTVLMELGNRIESELEKMKAEIADIKRKLD